MFLVGLPHGQGAWKVGLEDPRDSEQNVAVLHVGPGAVATSSITKRRWRQGGEEHHHLIDPRTGKSAEDRMAQRNGRRRAGRRSRSIGQGGPHRRLPWAG